MTRDEFARVIVPMQEGWLGLATRFFGDSEAARDALQETLLRLWVVRERICDEEHLERLGWRVIKQQCVSASRRAHTEALDNHDCDTVLASEPDVGEGLSGQEERELLAAAVERLSLSTRCLMQMHLYDGMSLDEIADATGKTKGSVKTMLSRAKQRIRQWITTN